MPSPSNIASHAVKPTDAMVDVGYIIPSIKEPAPKAEMQWLLKNVLLMRLGS